ncbi:MAG: dihydrofolate reductase [Novosphingobium sp.]|nr:dihydrofolate reductase [Novosphingobium sp.]
MHQNLTSIVAIDRHGAIGCQNRLPWSIKSDMAFFRRTTMGHTVIMGRKTHDSIGGCLKGRTNLVLSHNAVLFPSTEACRLVNSVAETLAVADAVNCTETFVIGGAATYAEFAPFVDRYLVTMVSHDAPDADAFLSQQIRAEYSQWTASQIAEFPAKPGQDEFAFRIMSFVAPDADERREMRKAIANQFLAKRPNQANKTPKRRGSFDTSSQIAFSF